MGDFSPVESKNATTPSSSKHRRRVHPLQQVVDPTQLQQKQHLRLLILNESSLYSFFASKRKGMTPAVMSVSTGQSSEALVLQPTTNPRFKVVDSKDIGHARSSISLSFIPRPLLRRFRPLVRQEGDAKKSKNEEGFSVIHEILVEQDNLCDVRWEPKSFLTWRGERKNDGADADDHGMIRFSPAASGLRLGFLKVAKHSSCLRFFTSQTILIMSAAVEPALQHDKENVKKAPVEGYQVPWVEKYRPRTLDDVLGNEETVLRLRAIAKDGNLPNLILCGPPGTGACECYYIYWSSPYVPSAYSFSVAR